MLYEISMIANKQTITAYVYNAIIFIICFRQSMQAWTK